MERDKPNVKQGPREWFAVKRTKSSAQYQFYAPHKLNRKTIEDISPDGGNFEVIQLVEYSALAKALERIEVLEKALKFYSASDNYKFIYPGGPCPALIIQDNGELAREALKGGE